MQQDLRGQLLAETAKQRLDTRCRERSLGLCFASIRQGTSSRSALENREIAKGDLEDQDTHGGTERFARTDIEIHYDADLPAWSGLGTSSAFGVGLVGALAGILALGKAERPRPFGSGAQITLVAGAGFDEARTSRQVTKQI